MSENYFSVHLLMLNEIRHQLYERIKGIDNINRDIVVDKAMEILTRYDLPQLTKVLNTNVDIHYDVSLMRPILDIIVTAMADDIFVKCPFKIVLLPHYYKL